MAFEPRWPFFRLLMIDLARKTRVRAELPRLRKSQWLSLDELQAIQYQKMRELASFVVSRVPFYADFAREIGLDVNDFKSLDDVTSFPVMTKARMKQLPGDFMPTGGSREPVLTRKTGGSTGTPFVYQMGLGAVTGQWASIFRAWEWSGYQLGDVMATVGGGSVAPANGRSFAHLVYDRLRRNTPLSTSPLTEKKLAAVVAALRSVHPVMVYGYPSLLYQIARLVRAGGEPLTGVRSVITTSEMLFPNQRRELEAAFGASVFDQYGCNEVNLVTCECEAHDGWHTSMESTYVEILDDRDQPLPPGEVGRIVATGLNNRGMPFVRYDTEDLGGLDARPCSCGRQLVRITKLQGRTRDLVRSPDGVLVHGVSFNEIVLKHSWVDRYQAVQLDAHDLVLKIDTSADVGRVDGDGLVAEVSALCGLNVSLQLNVPFEMTAGQKNRVIVSRLEVDPG